MIEALIYLSQRPIVIACALIGAALVVAGSLIGTPQPSRQAAKSDTPKGEPGQLVDSSDDDVRHANLWSKRLTKLGYAVTFVSIALFIVAGFVSDLHP